MSQITDEVLEVKTQWIFTEREFSTTNAIR